jgi:hypothetical protein
VKTKYLSGSFFFFYALKSEQMQRLPNAWPFRTKRALLADTVPRHLVAASLYLQSKTSYSCHIPMVKVCVVTVLL